MNDYLTEFERNLVQLTTAERAEVLNYYREYLEEGNFDNYQACVNELGTPRSLARKTLADYSIRMNDQVVDNQPNRRQKARNNIRMSWLIILALLSSPVTIPLLIGILFGIVGLGIAVLGIVFAVVMTLVGFLVLAATLLVAGVAVWSSYLWTGVFYVGAALFVVGVLMMLFPIIEWVIAKLMAGMAGLLKWAYQRVFQRNRTIKGDH